MTDSLRHELQADSRHPAPCARFCEAPAFNIEIRRLKQEYSNAYKALVRLLVVHEHRDLYEAHKIALQFVLYGVPDDDKNQNQSSSASQA